MPSLSPRCSSVWHMSSEPTDPRAAWHADLSERDNLAHARMSAAAHRSEVGILQGRLDALSAELDICRAAVQRRTQLIDEHVIALRERDAYIAKLESRASSEEAPVVRRPLPRRLASRAKRITYAWLRRA